MNSPRDDEERTRFIPQSNRPPRRPESVDDRTTIIPPRRPGPSGNPVPGPPRPPAPQYHPHPPRPSRPAGREHDRLERITSVVRAVVPPRPAVPPANAITIGRSTTNTFVVDDPVASRVHAFLVPTSAGLELRDNNSGNGTYVNGHRISAEILRQGDVITIGNTDLIARGNTLEYHTTAPDFRGVTGYGITLDIDGKTLLHGISFTAKPGTLTAVIGPSGAGKSTLSKLVAGLYIPTAGRVSFEGHDIHREYASLRTRIGMVPQDDVVHRLLTIEQALTYAAQLRLPDDLTDADRSQVIEQVLEELELTKHRHTRIDKLSGGQRKRASVAMELLTSPSLLILDEPTSGLDPALDRQVMMLLRKLADAGRVVLVVTHNTAHLDVCDQVLLLAPGGKTAFANAPAHIGRELGTTNWADIFARASADPDGVHHDYLRRHPHPPTPPMPPAGGPPPHPERPPSNFYRQLWTVARRQAHLIAADRGYLAVLVGIPFLLGFVALALPGDRGLGIADPKDPSEAITVLAVMSLIAVFMGTALTVRDLVGERPIFQREQAVGLSASVYLGAKLGIYGAIAAAQAAVLTIMFVIFKGGPTRGAAALGSPTFELYVTVAATAIVSAVLGLALSAIAKSENQVLQMIVGVLIASVVFSGGLIPVTGRAVMEQIAGLLPGRWGFAASASTSDLRALSQFAKDDVLWTHSAGWWFFDLLMLFTIGLLLTGFVRWKLRLPTSGTSSEQPDPAVIIGVAIALAVGAAVLLCGIIVGTRSHTDRPTDGVRPAVTTPSVTPVT